MKNFEPKTTKTKKGTWTVFLGLCKGCGICLVKCPVKALIFGKEKGVVGQSAPKVIPEKCNLCQTCEINCPDVAIRVDKND
ncbi:4Fe-4S binding protein [Patescibacteria group bacterium]|nr:4Fe-4S binding protein [Patescibacteria group bacterium]